MSSVSGERGAGQAPASAHSVWKGRLPWLATAVLAVISILLAIGWWQSVQANTTPAPYPLGLQLGIEVPTTPAEQLRFCLRMEADWCFPAGAGR